jgi:probable F420-dependent oxidoreductase
MGRPLSLFGLRGSFRQLTEAAVLAERLGFGGVSFGEHHGQKATDWPDPLIVLAGLAGVTERLTLGTSISLLPLYNPVQFAERVATIDQMSGGRMELGVGAGYDKIDFAVFGAPFAGRFRRLEEGIVAIKRLWTDYPASFDGEQYSFHDVRLWPRPVQPGGPPVLLSAWSEPGVRRAATIGDGWIIDPAQCVSLIEPWNRLYRDIAGPRGKTVLMRYWAISDGDADLAARCERHLLEIYSFYLRRAAIDSADPRLTDPHSLTADQVTADRVLWGTAEEIAETLKDWVVRLEPDEIQLCCSAIPPEHLLDQIKLMSVLLS